MKLPRLRPGDVIFKAQDLLWDIFAIIVWLLLLPFALVTSLAGIGMPRYIPRVWGWLVMKAHGFTLNLEQQLDDLEQPAVYISNHQSKLDTPLLASIWPHRCVIVAKREILYVPVIGFIAWLTGQILLDRRNTKKSVAALESAAREMQVFGKSVWIFPEGTRAVTNRVLPFKLGAFRLAIEAKVPIIPVVLHRYTGAERWPCSSFRRAVWGSHFEGRVLAPIPTAGLTADDAPALALHAHTVVQQAVDSMEPHRHGD